MQSTGNVWPGNLLYPQLNLSATPMSMRMAWRQDNVPSGEPPAGSSSSSQTLRAAVGSTKPLNPYAPEWYPGNYGGGLGRQATSISMSSSASPQSGSVSCAGASQCAHHETIWVPTEYGADFYARPQTGGSPCMSDGAASASASHGSASQESADTIIWLSREECEEEMRVMADTYRRHAMPDMFWRHGVYTYFDFRMLEFHAAVALCHHIKREELYEDVEAIWADDPAATEQVFKSLEMVGLADL